MVFFRAFINIKHHDSCPTKPIINIKHPCLVETMVFATAWGCVSHGVNHVGARGLRPQPKKYPNIRCLDPH